MTQAKDRYFLHLLYAITAAYFALFITLDFLRLYGWGYGLIDLGNFNHFIWNSSEGNWWKTSVNYPYHPETNRLGIHFSFLSVLVATPFYWLFPRPETLLTIHVLSMSLSAIVIFHAAKHIGIKAKEAFLWALVYLINPLTIYATLFSFQDHSLAVLITSFIMLGITSNNLRMIYIACFLLALCKEHYGIDIIGVGMLYYYKNKDLKHSLIIVSIGVIAVVSVLFIIMPHFSNVSSHYMLSNDIPEDLPYGRYQWIYLPFSEMMARMFEILFSTINLKYYAWLFLPFLLLPFMVIPYMFPAMADIAASTLSGVYVPKTMTLYHSSSVIPVLVIASIYGSIKLKKYLKEYRRLIAPFIIVCCFFTFIISHFPPILSSLLLLNNERMVWATDEKFEKFKNFLTPDKKIISGADIGVLVSQRRNIYPLASWKTADYDTFIARTDWSTFKISGIPMSTVKIPEVYRKIKDPDWGITYWDDPFIAFEQGKKDVVDFALVMRKLSILAQQYEAIKKEVESQGLKLEGGVPKVE